MIDLTWIPSQIGVAMGMGGIEIVADLVTGGDDIPHRTGGIDVEAASQIGAHPIPPLLIAEYTHIGDPPAEGFPA